MKILNLILLIFYFLTVAIMSRYTLKHSDYDLDILLYTACTIEDNYSDKNQIHMKVYQMAKEELPSSKYNEYVDSTRIFRNNLHKNPNAFLKMLPYYKVKGLYISILKQAHHFGVSPIIFSTYANIFCYFLISILILLLLLEYLNFHTGFTIAYLSLLLPSFTSALKSNTPDLLAATLLLLGVFFLLRKQNSLKYLSLPFFAALVYCRNENVIFMLLLCALGIFYFQVKDSKRILIILGGICLLSYFLNTHSINGSSWKDLYKLSSLPPEDIQSPAGQIYLKEYILGLRRIPNNIFYCGVTLIFLFSLLPLLQVKSKFRENPFYLLLVSNLLFLILRILLLPDISDRYFCASYLISVLCFPIIQYERTNESNLINSGELKEKTD